MSFSDRFIHQSGKILQKIGLEHLTVRYIHKFPEREPENDSETAKLFFSHTGRMVSKWDHYYDIYERHFSQFKGKPIRFLEIGLQHGGSIQVWRKFFGPSATIFGIDVDSRCAVIDEPPSINVRIGSQADANFLRSVVKEMGGVDAILDDGSHVVGHQRASFETLFPLLSESGVYMIEDMHTNYWRGYYQGGWRRRSTFQEQMKDLVDDMHAWWHKKPQRHADAHKTVHGVHFYDSIVVVEKKPRPSPYSHSFGTPSF